jgi:Fe-S-cluster containining protein
MDIRFKCTQCGQCCRDSKIPLTVTEAIAWLNRGHEVQILCEASPWPAALDNEPRALHFKRRSFAVTSGSLPARVVVLLVANVVGRCPNLLADNRCGIYQDRPLVCRIYPAEINPLIELKADNKACPPEAWAQEQPLLYRGGKSMDEVMAQDIRSARESGARDAEHKRRLCLALNVVDTALVHEAVLVFSPAAKTLLSALTDAAAVHSPQEPEPQWRFVSDQPDTLANLTQSGATVLHPRAAAPAAFQLLGSKREPLFGF